MVVRSLFKRLIDTFQLNRTGTPVWGRLCSRTGKGGEVPTAEILRVPSLPIDEIFPGCESFPITLVDYKYEYGTMPVHELMTLCRMIRYKRPRVAFEIGTYHGGTTLQIASHSEAEVYTLDMPPRGHPNYVRPQVRDRESDVYPDQPGIRFHQTPYKNRIHQLFGDSLSFNFRPYWGKVDLVFIDGSHHNEFVLSDSHNALKMISPQGIVVWHDYASYAPGVVGVLEKLAKIIPLKHVAGTSLVVHQR